MATSKAGQTLANQAANKSKLTATTLIPKVVPPEIEPIVLSKEQINAAKQAVYQQQLLFDQQRLNSQGPTRTTGETKFIRDELNLTSPRPTQAPRPGELARPQPLFKVEFDAFGLPVVKTQANAVTTPPIQREYSLNSLFNLVKDDADPDITEEELRKIVQEELEAAHSKKKQQKQTPPGGLSTRSPDSTASSAPNSNASSFAGERRPVTPPAESFQLPAPAKKPDPTVEDVLVFDFDQGNKSEEIDSLKIKISLNNQKLNKLESDIKLAQDEIRSLQTANQVAEQLFEATKDVLKEKEEEFEKCNRKMREKTVPNRATLMTEATDAKAVLEAKAALEQIQKKIKLYELGYMKSKEELDKAQERLEDLNSEREQLIEEIREDNDKLKELEPESPEPGLGMPNPNANGGSVSPPGLHFGYRLTSSTEEHPKVIPPRAALSQHRT